MSDEQSKQPRKVKDLKARLGRTIAPNTPGAPAITPPAGGVVPPPGVGAAPTGEGGVPAPVLPPPGVTPVQPGAPLPALQLGPKPIVAPLFVQQQEEKKKEPVGPREVRIVVDDSAVADSDVGRTGRNKALIGIVAAVSLIAIGIGYGVGITMSNRRNHNAGVTAAQEISRSVNEGQAAIDRIRAQLDKLKTAARGAANTPPKVDYEALQAMRAVENPFRADRFSRRRYTAFDAAAVDALFQYYLRTTDLFEAVERTTARNLSPRRRTELDEAATNAASLMTDQTGCVPVIENQRVFCNLVYVDPPAAGAAPSPMLRVRPQRTGGTPTEREIYTGQAIVQNPDKFVILTNTGSSVGVLGQRATAFAEYTRDVTEIERILGELDQARQRFTQNLTSIKNLPLLWTP